MFDEKADVPYHDTFKIDAFQIWIKYTWILGQIKHVSVARCYPFILSEQLEQKQFK